MKRFKQRLSWLLIMTMIASQSVFLSAADTADEDEYYEEDTVLLNDLAMGNSPMRSKIVKATKWNPLASPSVTVSEKPESISGGKYTVYYANGNDITILASASNTYIVEDKTGAVTEVESGGTYVFAGATQSNASYGTVNITMNGGYVSGLVGANRYDGKIDTANITINGGEVSAVIANQGGNGGGASSYANRKNYYVGTSNIVLNGGEADWISGTYGYTYVNNLNMTIGSDYGVGTGNYGSSVRVGTNGEVNKATITLDGGTIANISLGQRVMVGDMNIDLKRGVAGDVYLGSYYPTGESSTENWWTTGMGNVNYASAKKMQVKIAEGVQYSGLYAGFNLLKDEVNAFVAKYGDQSLYSELKDTLKLAGKGSVTVNLAEAPSGEPDNTPLEGSNILENRDIFDEFINWELPTLTVKNAAITKIGGETVADSDTVSAGIVPGTEVTVVADVAPVDQKFTGWEAVGLKDSLGEDKEVTFDMPSGSDGATVTAVFADKSFALDKAEVTLDLNLAQKSNRDIVSITDDFDYASPSIASYDESIINMEDYGDGSFGLSAVKEGTTNVVFQADGTTKTASLKVKVVDSRPTFSVVNGSATWYNQEYYPDEIFKGTTGRLEPGTRIELEADTLLDKLFTGWDNTLVEEDGSMEMPSRDTMVTALYRDKVFAFTDPTLTSVALNVDQTETNTGKLPNAFSFGIVSDYVDVQVTGSNNAVASMSKNEDGTYSVQAVAAGLATIRAAAKKDDGTTQELTIAVTVSDTTKPIQAESGKVTIDTSKTEIKEAEVPADVPKEQVEALQKDSEEKAKQALESITNNTTVQSASVTGFDRAANLQELGVPAGVAVKIFPKQTLQKVETALVQTGTEIDPVTQEVKPVYEAVVSKIVFDISAFMKADSEADKLDEQELTGIKGRFSFPIPVPAGISSTARYAKVTHISNDTPGGRSEISWLSIKTNGTDQYVDMTVTHFSTFEIEFAASKPGSGSSGGSGGGGGSSFTSTSAGRWIMTEQGWWYRYSNAGYPVNAWAYLDGAASGMAWYHFDAAGYMQAGWFTDTDGHRYYLHNISDGNRGTMYSGWHQIDGKWYYFTETRTDANPAGSLLTNTTTPDGFAVDETGARR